MPWKIKRELYFIMFGVVCFVLSSIVLGRDSSTDTELLGTIGALGDLVIIFTGVVISHNGNGHDNSHDNDHDV